MEAYARVDEGDEHVGEDVAEEEEEGGDHHDAHAHEVVAVGDGGDAEQSEAVDVEDGLDEERAGQEQRDVLPEGGGDGDDGVAAAARKVLPSMRILWRAAIRSRFPAARWKTAFG